jgi:hypothetical protein
MYLVSLHEFNAIVLLALPSQRNSPADAYDKRLEAFAEIVNELLLRLATRHCLQPVQPVPTLRFWTPYSLSS